MKRPKLSFGDLLAIAKRNLASSRLSTPVLDETDDLQEELADARREARNALAEWRSYETPYYEAAWSEALDKVQRLEARIPKRKAMSGG